MVCLGQVILLGACSFAQNTAPQSSGASSHPATQSTSPAGDQSPTNKSADKDSADHKTHVRLGGFVASAGYAHFAPGFYPYAFYNPFYYPFSPVYAAMLWDPFWGMYSPVYPPGYFSAGTDKGEVKLAGAPKDAAVYIDGGYAGTIAHLKSVWLDPGAYDLAVTSKDGRRFDQRVYVLTGKSLKIVAALGEQPTGSEKP